MASLSLQSVLDRIASLFTTSSNNLSSRPYLAALSTALALGGVWVIRDKTSWVNYGTGGTPPTWAGYWRSNVVFRTKRLLARDSLRDSSPLSKTGPRYLPSPLPVRKTSRPRINAWTLPQRQASYQGSARSVADSAMLTRLHGTVDRLVAEHGDVLYKDLSNTEGRSVDAIYARPALPGRDPGAKDRLIGDEIAHVHYQEHSLHVWLAQPDCAEVVEKGWGERFPLSSLGLLHPSQTFVYAPVDEEELAVVEQIIAAGVAHLTGKKI